MSWKEDYSDDARLMSAARTGRHIGINNPTDFYAHVARDKTFPLPIRREIEPAKDGTKRYSHPRWDRVDVDAWIERQKAPMREAEEQVARLMERARGGPRRRAS